MTVEDYLKEHPEENPAWVRAAVYVTTSGVIYRAMIQFDSDCLAGCFKGNYGGLCVYDARVRWPNSFTETREQYIARVRARRDKEQRQGKLTAKERRTRYGKDDSVWIETPTADFPVGVKITGTDDSSYTKFFADPDEAVAYAKLLEELSPLYFQFMYEEGFVFTN